MARLRHRRRHLPRREDVALRGTGRRWRIRVHRLHPGHGRRAARAAGQRRGASPLARRHAGPRRQPDGLPMQAVLLPTGRGRARATPTRRAHADPLRKLLGGRPERVPRGERSGQGSPYVGAADQRRQPAADHARRARRVGSPRPPARGRLHENERSPAPGAREGGAEAACRPHSQRRSSSLHGRRPRRAGPGPRRPTRPYLQGVHRQREARASSRRSVPAKARRAGSRASTSPTTARRTPTPTSTGPTRCTSPRAFARPGRAFREPNGRRPGSRPCRSARAPPCPIGS